MSMENHSRISKMGKHIILVIICLTMVLPFYWMIVTALKTPQEIMKFPPTLFPSNPTLKNFLSVFDIKTWSGDRLILVSFTNSLIVAVSATVGALFTCSMAGYAFSKVNFRLRSLFFWLILVWLMIPNQITLIPLYVVFAKLNLVDTLYPLILPTVLLNSYGVFLLTQAISNIPNAYLEAARLDGANHWSIYTKIILPIIRPSMITLGLLVFLGRWNDFFGPLIFINSDDNFTLPLAMNWFRGRYRTDWGVFMAAAALSVIPVIIMYLIGQKYLSEGVSTISGIKG